MNNEAYDKNEEVVDVPYYTRDLCKENTFRLARRIIKSQNVLRYRRQISEIVCGKDYFQTEALKKIDDSAIRFSK